MRTVEGLPGAGPEVIRTVTGMARTLLGSAEHAAPTDARVLVTIVDQAVTSVVANVGRPKAQGRALAAGTVNGNFADAGGRRMSAVEAVTLDGPGDAVESGMTAVAVRPAMVGDTVVAVVKRSVWFHRAWSAGLTSQQFPKVLTRECCRVR